VLLFIFDILTSVILRADIRLVLMFRETLLPPSSGTNHTINLHGATFPKTVLFKFTPILLSLALCVLLNTVHKLSK
jgi:hypothetical protein